MSYENDFPKPQIKQKNTWIGVALVGFGVYQCFFVDLTTGVASIVAGIGLIFSLGN